MRYSSSMMWASAVDFAEWKEASFNAASGFSGMHEVRCVLAEYFDYSWRLKIPE